MTESELIRAVLEIDPCIRSVTLEHTDRCYQFEIELTGDLSFTVIVPESKLVRAADPSAALLSEIRMTINAYRSIRRGAR